MAQENHKPRGQITCPLRAQVKLKFLSKTKAQKHILSVVTHYLICTKSSRHKIASTKKEKGSRRLLEALRTSTLGDIFCQVN